MINVLAFFLREAWSNFRRHKVASFTTFFQASLSLLLLGTCLVFLFNASHIVSTVLSNVKVVVFLKDDISYIDRDNLEEAFREDTRVSRVIYSSKEDAREMAGDHLSLDLQGLLGEDANPFPAHFNLTLKNAGVVKEFAETADDVPWVEKVVYSEERLKTLFPILTFIRGASFFLAVFLAAGILLIIMNTIRLAVLSRSQEIRIMQLVGATDWFIRMPFILEGLGFGLGGAIVASTLSVTFYNFSIGLLEKSLLYVPFLVAEADMNRGLIIVLTTLGLFLGIVGSYLSVEFHLKEGES